MKGCIERNGRQIAYPSGCDNDCMDEWRLFNGRGCPRRKSCLYENGALKELSRDDIGIIRTQQRQLLSASIDIMNNFGH